MKKIEPGSGRLFVVSAPSGAGKTSLVQALTAQSDEIGVAVSHTTRERRPDEADGVNYHFVNEPTFARMVEDGAFLEWARVFGHCYGTTAAAANKVMSEGKHLILEIDWQGAQQIRRKLPRALSIFIFPPSLQALQDRLLHRAQDDAETVERRMAAALEELSHWREFDFLIVNDDFGSALTELGAVVSGHGDRLRQEKRADSLAPLITDLLPQH